MGSILTPKYLHGWYSTNGLKTIWAWTVYVPLFFLNLFSACDDAIWRHETFLHDSGTQGVNQKMFSEWKLEGLRHIPAYETQE